MHSCGIVKNTIYTEVCAYTQIDPSFTRVYLTILPAQLTAAKHDHIICLFEEESYEYQEHLSILAMFLKKITEAVNTIYLLLTTNLHTKLSKILIQDSLNFLFNHYRQIINHGYLLNNER